MNPKNIKDLIKIDQKIAELQELRESVREDIMDELEEAGLEKAVTELGTVTRAVKTSWTFTDKVKTLEEKVKVAKVKEQQSGAAARHETYYLRFTPVKQD